MRAIQYLLSTLLILGVSSAFAVTPQTSATTVQEPLKLSVFGILNDRTSEISGGAEEIGYEMGAGAMVSMGLSALFSVETGAMYFKRQYEIRTSEYRIIQQAGRIHVPVLFRFSPSEYFSIGAGPFLGIRAGDTITAVRQGDTLNRATSANDDIEFGLDAAAAVSVEVAEATDVFLEGRYTDIVAEESQESSSDLTALAGVRMNL